MCRDQCGELGISGAEEHEVVGAGAKSAHRRLLRGIRRADHDARATEGGAQGRHHRRLRIGDTQQQPYGVRARRSFRRRRQRPARHPQDIQQRCDAAPARRVVIDHCQCRPIRRHGPLHPP
jgi:hypothetical protein